jgi:DNA polymerase (family 10)
MTNAEIARALREMALHLEMEEVQFKPRAYEKAAHAIEAVAEPLERIPEEGRERKLRKIPAVGKGIAEKIEELLRTGRIAELESMRERRPVDVEELVAVEGLGPRGVRALYDALGVRSLEELERAAREGRIRALPHFGEKSERKILRGIALRRAAAGRMALGRVLEHALRIEARLREHPSVEAAAVAGSIRRRKETVGDLDFVAVSESPEAVVERFLAMPEVAEVYAAGRGKAMVRLSIGLDADLRVVPPESFGSALCYFTGSKDHNVALRRIAQRKGLKLNEYGLLRGARRIAGRTEEEVYEALGLPYIPPELREGSGEIEAALRGELPDLVGYEALRGDLQIHTDATDGANSLAEMVEAARASGLQYIAVTDHTRDLPMARGFDEERLLEQAARIRRLDRRLRGFRVLCGAEVNIRRDGSLDVAEEALAELDVVGAAIHSSFGLPRDEMTRRVVRAMESPHVDILFHPTARALGRRAPVEVDIDAVIQAALRTGTILEVDAQPERLDLKDEYVRKAVRAGVPIAIDSDAHSVSELRFARDYGVAVARRGWARESDVVNARPCRELLAALKKARGAARG